MKRLLVLMLAVLLIFQAQAFADQDILVSGSQQAYDNIQVLGSNVLYTDDVIWIYYELYNAGKNPIHIDHNHSSVQFFDRNGKMIYEWKGTLLESSVSSKGYNVMSFDPWIVEPGQKFYISDMVWKNVANHPEEKEAYRKILQASSYKLNLTITPSYNPNDLYKNSHPSLPVTWKYSMQNEKSTHWLKMDLKVSNNTSRTAEDVLLVFVIRDSRGNPVAIDTTTEYNVNIPAHGSKQITRDYVFIFEQLDLLLDNGFNITGVDVLAYLCD